MIDKNKLVQLIQFKYHIGEIVRVEENKVGWNDNFILITSDNKYFVKTFKNISKNNHSESEVLVCKKLNSEGIRTSKFIEDKQGNTINKLDEIYSFHVQEFIRGDIWKKNSATEDVLIEGVSQIAQIHSSLANIELEYRFSIMQINDKKFHSNKILSILDKIEYSANIKCKKEIVRDLTYRKRIIDEFELFDLNKLTMVNGHGDYSITQIISCEDGLATIDFTEASRVPAIWEIMRFYLNSVSKSDENCSKISLFVKCLEVYSSVIPLSNYDYRSLFTFNYIYMCEAVSVYERFLDTFDLKFLQRALLRIKKLEDLKILEKDYGKI